MQGGSDGFGRYGTDGKVDDRADDRADDKADDRADDKADDRAGDRVRFGANYRAGTPRRPRGVGAHRAVEEPDNTVVRGRFGRHGLITENPPGDDRGVVRFPEPRGVHADDVPDQDDVPEPRGAPGSTAPGSTELGATGAAPNSPAATDSADPAEGPAPDGGWTLREVLDRRRLAPAEAALVGAQLARDLAALHAEGKRHGQLTPSAVRLDPDGRARLLDPPALPDDSLDPASVPYLAPEQVAGDELGRPADVYSLGLVLLESVTGFAAYPGSSWEAAAMRLTAPPVVPNEVSGQLAGALLAMTQRAPMDRPSAERAAARLRGGPVVPPLPPRPERSSLGQFAGLGLPVLVLLVLIAVALLGHHGDLSDRPASGTAAAPITAGASSTATPTPARTPIAAAPAPARTTAPAARGTTAAPTTGATPALPAVALPNVGDLPATVTDKVKDAISDTITDKVKSTWQKFTDWLSSLF